MLDADAKTLFLAGKAAHDGIGEIQNYAKARELYIQAANRGSTEALINLGYLHFVGQGVPINMHKARFFYAAAADLGSKDARANIAMMDARKLGLGQAPEAPKSQTSTSQTSTYKASTPKLKPSTITPAPRAPLVRETSPQSAAGVAPSVLEDQITAEISSPDIIPDIKPEFKRDYTALIPPLKNTAGIANSTDDRNGDKGENTSTRTRSLNAKIAITLLALAALILLQHGLHLRKTKRQNRIRRLFAETFYDASRSDLRLTYLRRRNCHFVEATFYKQWAATLNVLMARFALSYDGPDKTLEAFCNQLNDDLFDGLQPTRKLASEFSDLLMDATVSEIKAVDAFHRETVTPVRKERVTKKNSGAFKAAHPYNAPVFLAQKSHAARQAR